MAAGDWENPHPCDEEPEELENIWNMHNCIWLSVGNFLIFSTAFKKWL